jgi:hypothetical protein
VTTTISRPPRAASQPAQLIDALIGDNRRREGLVFVGVLAFLAIFWGMTLWTPATMLRLLTLVFNYEDVRSEVRNIVNHVTLIFFLSLVYTVWRILRNCSTVLQGARPFILAAHQIAGHRSNPRPLLNGLANSARQLSHLRGIPNFARRHLQLVAMALEFAAAEPDSALRIFAAIFPPANTTDFEYRPVAQFLVTGLLFIGIVGTLYGLVDVLSAERITDILNSVAGSDADKLGRAAAGLARSFGLAFGASLVAYIAYLFGRFLLDIADQAHDGLTAVLDRDLLNGCRLVLAPLQSEVRIDLSQRSRDLLEAQSSGLQAIAVQEAEQVAELQKLASRLARTATLFNRATQRATAAAQVIAKSLTRGREEWQQASAIWRENTTHFATEAATLGRVVGDYITAINTAGADVRVAVLEVDAAIRRITDIWRDHLRETMQGLADGVSSYSAVIRQSGNAITGLIEAFGETRDMVHRGAETIGGGQRALEAAIERIEQEQRAAGERLLAILNARAQSLEASLFRAVEQIEPLRDDIARIARAASDLRAATLGSGQVDDLLTVLSRLDELLRTRAFQ